MIEFEGLCRVPIFRETTKVSAPTAGESGLLGFRGHIVSKLAAMFLPRPKSPEKCYSPPLIINPPTPLIINIPNIL